MFINSRTGATVQHLPTNLHLRSGHDLHAIAVSFALGDSVVNPTIPENQLNPRENGLLCQVLHEHLGRLNNPSSPDLPRPPPPGLHRVSDDDATAAASAAAKKREAAEQVAAFRWRPAPPQVEKSSGTTMKHGRNGAGKCTLPNFSASNTEIQET